MGQWQWISIFDRYWLLKDFHFFLFQYFLFAVSNPLNRLISIQGKWHGLTVIVEAYHFKGRWFETRPVCLILFLMLVVDHYEVSAFASAPLWVTRRIMWGKGRQFREGGSCEEGRERRRRAGAATRTTFERGKKTWDVELRFLEGSCVSQDS